MIAARSVVPHLPSATPVLVQSVYTANDAVIPGSGTISVTSTALTTGNTLFYIAASAGSPGGLTVTAPSGSTLLVNINGTDQQYQQAWAWSRLISAGMSLTHTFTNTSTESDRISIAVLEVSGFKTYETYHGSVTPVTSTSDSCPVTATKINGLKYLISEQDGSGVPSAVSLGSIIHSFVNTAHAASLVSIPSSTLSDQETFTISAGRPLPIYLQLNLYG